MQLLGSLFVIFVGMVLGALMLFNTVEVPLHLDPFGWRVRTGQPVMVPLWQVMLGALIAGWLIGQLLEWLTRVRHGNGGGGGDKPTDAEKKSVDDKLGLS